MKHHTHTLAGPTLLAALALAALAPAYALANTPAPRPAENDTRTAQTDDPSDDPADEAGHTFTDFTDDEHNDRWRSVNDNVMGGRSRGNFVFDDGVMTFAGSINTNGGGFASVRFRLDPQTLLYTSDHLEDRATGEPGQDEAQPQPYTRIQFRIKTDGRPYRLLLADDTRYQRRNISYRALLTPPPAPGTRIIPGSGVARQSRPRRPRRRRLANRHPPPRRPHPHLARPHRPRRPTLRPRPCHHPRHHPR